MTTLSFNPARIRTPTFKHSKLSSSSKPITISCTISSNNLRNHPKLLRFRTNSVSESSLSIQKEAPEEVVEDEEDDPTAELCYVDPAIDPESITEWELDFCSRPILDDRGKKIWELVVCDKTLSLQYTKYFPNNVINSITLKEAIAGISNDLGVPLPQNIRFFRSQMKTIITKACNELRIAPVPSKRCVTLILWLGERYETVYRKHPGFQEGSKPLLAVDNPFPTELPDDLYGEKWAFVQLPYSAVREEVSSFKAGFRGAGLDLDLLGLEIDDKTLIPGLAVASSRATELAALINEVEACAVEADAARGRLILSVGISTRYVYSTYKKTPVTTSESEGWEAAKEACGGLHFLAIQKNLDSEDCAGFFLLLDLPFPPV
ncbi:protein TAB2 homolog, chloroplastic [Abrus precatorius]|uniref:Protein TAB2 homolog, chloroplastic n=1 Tax=Abrus precatorius TaxID=3816 RepID=A0A8B8KEH3_ABRPR|nr:protein TAB2 homolog, chloroplastic [Abrus precatorius]